LSGPEARSRELGAVYGAIDEAIAELDGPLRELSLDLHGHPELALAEHRSAKLLRDWFAQHLAELGEEVEEAVLRGGTGSSDIGNVSLRLPAIHPYIKVMPRGTPGHSHAMTEAVAGMDAHRAMLRMAAALAKTGTDLFCDGASLDEARREFAVSGPDLPA
jgi:metal-dependent amidase/aminoacylase/carboxypeptidase family protein